MALIPLTCPNCRGKAEVNDCREFATCQYCGSKIILNRPATVAPPAPPPPTVYPSPPPPNAPVVVKPDVLMAGCRTIMVGCGVVFACFILLVVVGALLGDSDRPSVSTVDPVIQAQDFIRAAEKAGYTVIVEDDYDGHGTYWAGAHKFADGAEKKEGNEIYVIDYTRDKSKHNSKIEYAKYVAKVDEIGGNSHSDSGSDHQFQVNSSATRFGIAYRIGDVNLYVNAGAEHKDEITAFFDAIGFCVEAKQ